MPQVARPMVGRSTDRRPPKDVAFIELIQQYRPMLWGAAYLVWGDEQAATDVVEAAAARSYQHWGRGGLDHRLDLIRRVVSTNPANATRPWRVNGGTVELIDVVSAEQWTVQNPVVRALSQLPLPERLALVLSYWCELDLIESAQVMGLETTEAERLRAAALERWGREDRRRPEPEQLAEQLNGAVRDSRGARDRGARDNDQQDPALDLAHGRWLRRRRWVRSSLAAFAILAALVLGLSQLAAPDQGNQSADDEAGRSMPSSGTRRPAFTHSCDTRLSTCREAVVRRWRMQMAGAALSNLDPRRTYFSGFAPARDPRQEVNLLWSPKGGAMELDLRRRDDSAVVVNIQIATSQEYAIGCGEITRQACVGIELMDGNHYTMTSSTTLEQGMEVQYSPDGKQVITVIARRLNTGKAIDIKRSQLVALVQNGAFQIPRI